MAATPTAPIQLQGATIVQMFLGFFLGDRDCLGVAPFRCRAPAGWVQAGFDRKAPRLAIVLRRWRVKIARKDGFDFVDVRVDADHGRPHPTWSSARRARAAISSAPPKNTGDIPVGLQDALGRPAGFDAGVGRFERVDAAIDAFLRCRIAGLALNRTPHPISDTFTGRPSEIDRTAASASTSASLPSSKPTTAGFPVVADSTNASISASNASR